MKRALRMAFVLTLAVWHGLGTGAAGRTRRAAAGPEAQGGPAGQAGGGGGRAAITPRIVTFEAKPVSIKPGRVFRPDLADEAGTGTLTMGLATGAAARNDHGDAQGDDHLHADDGRRRRDALGDGYGRRDKPVAPTPVDAGTAAVKPIAAHRWKPDFSGIYGFTGMARRWWRPRRARRRSSCRTASIAVFQSPTQPALKPGVDNRATPNPAGGTADCLPLPADTAFGVPYPFQIFQNRNYVILINEYPGTPASFRSISRTRPTRTRRGWAIRWPAGTATRWSSTPLPTTASSR